jgi:hypothetical protein
LEEAGLIRAELEPASRGLRKICARMYDRIVLDLPVAETPRDQAVEMTMPVGAFVDCQVALTCGLLSETGIIGMLDDPASFYDESGKLKPEFEQNLQRLREWLGYGTDLIGSSQCLQRRLSTPKLKGESCRPSYGGTVGRNGTP